MAVGATVLALFGAAGVAGMVILLGMDGSDPTIVGFALAVLVAAVVGFSLLVGYWLSWRSRLAPAQERALWWTSAAFNGLIAMAVAVAAVTLGVPLSGPDALLALAFVPAAAWPLWMTWFGVTRAKAVAGGAGPLGEQTPADRSVPSGVIVAAVGSAGLTVQGLAGVWTFFSALGPGAFSGLDVIPWIGFLLAGAALTVGYAWAWFVGLPPGVERPFWWASAAINGASLLVTFGTLVVSYQDLWEVGGPFQLLWPVAGAAWSGWLAWYSVTRAEQAADEPGDVA